VRKTVSRQALANYDNNGVEMMGPFQNPSQLPGHEQVAALRVGAMLANQAIAVHVDPDQSGEPDRPPTKFDALPVRL
jgi:hypothetical protein